MNPVLKETKIKNGSEKPMYKVLFRKIEKTKKTVIIRVNLINNFSLGKI